MLNGYKLPPLIPRAAFLGLWSGAQAQYRQISVQLSYDTCCASSTCSQSDSSMPPVRLANLD